MQTFCQGAVRFADSRRLPIVGVGDLLLHFRCDSRVIALQLRNVAHVPELSHHLISLGRIASAGHEYSCDGEGLKVRLKSDRVLCAEKLGSLDVLHATRLSPGGTAFAAIAPSPHPPVSDTNVNINSFHCSFGHSNEFLLRETAKHMGVVLEGELHACERHMLKCVDQKLFLAWVV